jgi:hypothetical protein
MQADETFDLAADFGRAVQQEPALSVATDRD